jgi:hypothetical protein
MKKALQGNYNDRYLLLLKENLQLWEYHQVSVKHVEKQIDALLEDTKMVQLYNGIDLSSIAGINDSTMLRLLGEVGSGK